MGYILDALLGKGFQHTTDNHIVDGHILIGHMLGQFTCDDDGVMVRYFRAVHATACRFLDGECIETPHRTVFQGLQQFRNLGKDIFRYITASRSRIGDELRFIEFLGNGKCLFSREAVLTVGILLKSGQIVQQRCVFRFLLTDYFCKGGTACSFNLII